MPTETRLGGIVPFRNAGVPEFLLVLFAHVPGQEGLDIRRNLAAGRRARLQVPRQPFPGIELPHGQRGKNRKHRRGLLTAPFGTRAVEVLPRHCWSTLTSFRSVIVHRDPRIVHEQCQPLPMRLQAFQGLPAGGRELRSGQFRLHLRLHPGRSLAQAVIGLPELHRVLLRRQPAEKDSVEFREADDCLRQAAAGMKTQMETELARAELATPCRKTLESLQTHWKGLTLFVDDPRIPMDNNASERCERGPAVARKNFYGSGSEWSGQQAAAMFSIFATLSMWKLNPRKWLTWYLDACAAARGKGPADIQPFLPWNMSEEKKKEFTDTGVPEGNDTS